MIDYECITVGGLRGAKRLVAFGKFAGIAGMLDFFRGMGERFLALGFSTPFLAIAATYMYPSLDAAYNAVRECGEVITRYGLPTALGPLTTVFTGDGNVSQGAQEVFRLLGDCVKWVAPEELPACRAAQGRERTHVLYACVAKEQHMVARKDASRPFDKHEYRAQPDLYEPVFHETVVPHTSILVNAMYWDQKFPRLLTIKQAQALREAGRLPLLGVCDITCDFQGSVEFLKQFTSIEKPFFVYDLAADAVVNDDMDAPGILYHAVDHLPSECPRDASLHFGRCLLPFLPALARSDGSLPFDRQDDLPLEMKGAVVCAHGQLTPNFDYISLLRRAAIRADTTVQRRRMSKEATFVTVDLVGHLFDSGIINKILDRVEECGGSARILDFTVGKDRSTPTELRLQVLAHHAAHATPDGSDALVRLVSEVCGMAEDIGVQVSVESEHSHIHEAIATRSKAIPRSVMVPAKRVLVLGAGFVSGPLVEYLLRFPANHLTLASMIPGESDALAKGRARVAPIQLDVGRETERLSALVGQHDLVVSLVPAPCHPPIARMAIAHRKHMVTASYVSPEMRALQQEAAAAGIVILNEAGLDPGIDHMSALKLIDDAKDRGGIITGFSSVCGGLPAPESANNPLGYKFSWSPRGALSAARNTARYLRDGCVVDIPGEGLLTAAAPFRVNPAFALEVIPNRDSIPYADKYGIAGPALKTMFRGTLRYQGFCASLSTIVALGMLDLDAKPVQAGSTLKALLAAAVNLPASASDDEVFEAVVATASKAATEQVAASHARLSQLSERLVTLADAAAVACSNITLHDPIRRQTLRSFLSWAGFFSDAFAPLRGGDSGNGMDKEKHEVVCARAAAAGQPLPSGMTTHCPIDTLVAMLTGKPEMSFAGGERDMALMQHELEVLLPDGSTEFHTATLIEYANLEKNQTSMARTVGYTAAIGAQLILDGTITTPGLAEPVTREWYAPILTALEEEGIIMHEVKRVVPPAKQA
jgi:alpha-aminoadipic semialdehyde synthase